VGVLLSLRSHRQGVRSVIRQLRTTRAGDRVADRPLCDRGCRIGLLADLWHAMTHVSAVGVDRHNPGMFR